MVGAVSNELTDDALLGSDLGLGNLSEWLKLAQSNSICQTRAQAATELTEAKSDQTYLTNSGASPKLLEFSDDFFSQ